MTQQLKNWKTKLILWLEKRREKELKTEIELSKESILHLLTKPFTTEQSIEVFTDISLQFNNLMQQRLNRVSEEKTALESFLREKTK